MAPASPTPSSSPPSLPFAAGGGRTGVIAKPTSKAPVSRLRRVLQAAALLCVLALGSLFVPAVFRFALRQLIALEAWRHEVTVTIAEVQGSLYEPVVLRDSEWTFESRAGSVTRLHVERAVAEFSWQELLPDRGSHWFRRLALEGVSGKVEIPLPGKARARAGKAEEPHEAWYPAPTRIEANGVDLLFQTASDSVRLQGSRLLISELEPGFIDIAQLAVQQPWLNRSFRNIHGTTALREGELKIADLQLDPALLVRNISADARLLARGILDMDMELDAFGAKRIVAHASAVPGANGTEFETTVRFSEMSIAPLIDFLGISEAAGGTIRNGDLNFRGSPRDLAHASLTLRLDATDFQWDSRQWDSLVLGATLLGGRMQIPQLDLRQGHNHLSLSGEMALPNGRVPWWKSDFNFNIAARIENLTELSALLLPEFRFAAGKASIDGTVRMKEQQYLGTLVVSGSGLTWRSAPIQDLQASIRLAGHELQVANLDLINKDDSLRAQGVFSLDGSSTYRGELRASVEDLATYSALLQKPLIPEPLAGGATIRWMGEGSPLGQTGRFFARLQKLRPLSTAASQLHPVNAEVEGSYGPANLQFSRLDVADEACALHAQAEIGARSVHLHDLQLTHGAEIWLTGEAMLPVDVWHAWPELVSVADETPLVLKLKATGLSLREAARLTGWNWPIAGVLDGELNTEGALGHLTGASHLTLRDGLLPLTSEQDLLEGLSGEFALEGQTLNASKLTARHVSGSYGGEGTAELARFRDPALALRLRSAHAAVPLFRGTMLPVLKPTGEVAPSGLSGDFALDLEVAGPLSSATLKGGAILNAATMGGQPDLACIWKNATLGELPAPVSLPALFSGWKLDLDCAKSAAPALDVAPGREIRPSLHLGGTGAAPILTGKVELARLPVLAGPLALTLDDSSIVFREGFPRDPTLDLRATGLVDHFPFNAYALGPLTRHIAFLDSEIARAALLGAPSAAGAPPGGPSFPAWATFSNESSAPLVSSPPAPAGAQRHE